MALQRKREVFHVLRVNIMFLKQNPSLEFSKLTIQTDLTVLHSPRYAGECLHEFHIYIIQTLLCSCSVGKTASVKHTVEM